MPGEAVGEILSGVLRFIFRIFVEVFIEILIKGLGYIIYKPFNKNVDPDGLRVVFVGVLAWVFIVFVGYEFY